MFSVGNMFYMQTKFHCCTLLNKRIKYMKNCRWFDVVTKKTACFFENSSLLAFKPSVLSATKIFPVDEILTPRYLRYTDLHILKYFHQL